MAVVATVLGAAFGVFVILSVLDDARMLWDSAGWLGLATMLIVPALIGVYALFSTPRYRR